MAADAHTAREAAAREDLAFLRNLFENGDQTPILGEGRLRRELDVNSQTNNNTYGVMPIVLPQNRSVRAIGWNELPASLVDHSQLSTALIF